MSTLISHPLTLLRLVSHEQCLCNHGLCSGSIHYAASQHSLCAASIQHHRVSVRSSANASTVVMFASLSIISMVDASGDTGKGMVPVQKRRGPSTKPRCPKPAELIFYLVCLCGLPPCSSPWALLPPAWCMPTACPWPRGTPRRQGGLCQTVFVIIICDYAFM
jgi:hypothetical protein